jgi:WD40 repeat protein
VETLKPLADVPIGPSGVASCRLIESGKTLLIADDRSISLFDVATSVLRSTTKVSDDQTVGADASEDGKHVVTYDRTGLQIWRPGGGLPERIVREPVIPLGAQFSPDGTSLLVQLLGGERPYWLFLLSSGNEPFALPMKGLFLNHAPAPAFDAAGGRILVPWEKGFAILDAHTGREIASGMLLAQACETYDAAFSPDGSLVVVTTERTLGSAGPVHVFDARNGKLLHRLAVAAVAAQVTRDGQWAIVSRLEPGHSEMLTEVWNVATEQRQQVLRFGKRRQFDTTAASPNGDSIAQFVEGGPTIIWRRRRR